MAEKIKNIVMLVLAVLLAISVMIHFLMPYYQGKMRQIAQQATNQAVSSILTTIRQRVVSDGEVAIETSQGKMILVVKPEKKVKKGR